MKVKIQSIHFTCKPALNEFIIEKVGKLSHIANKIEFADVSLKLLQTSEVKNKICELRVKVGSHDHFASKRSETFEKAATAAVNALQEQIRKTKV